MTKAYYSVNGRILGEASGGTRLDYMTDALGSVTGTVDSSAQVVNTYRYKPYGELLAKTGSGSDPRFRWVGSSGYRQTGNRFSDVYVRASHYAVTLGAWATSDPTSAMMSSYSYVSAGPTHRIDPTGLDDAGTSRVGSHDHWLTVAYHAPRFFNCYLERIRGKPWTPQLAFEACKACKRNAYTHEYIRHVPLQCRDFVASSPPMTRHDPYTPQKRFRVNKPWYMTGSVLNMSRCIVRACWREPDGDVHCWDLYPQEMTDPWVDVDVVCYCGRAYKISDFNRIIVTDNLLEPERSTMAEVIQKCGSPPIYRDEEVEDRNWFRFEEQCRDAVKYITGECCTKARVRYRL